MKKIVIILVAGLFITVNSKAQLADKMKPFTFSGFGITVTGTYSEGFLNQTVVNGTSILWGLISWGGSTQTTCSPGSAVCRIEQIFSVQVNRTITSPENGLKSFDMGANNDLYNPVVIGEKDGNLTFAVDLTKVSASSRSRYESDEWVLERSFVLTPDVVKSLGLYTGKEEMGFIIPAGRYPLSKDGNIAFWTFNKPIQ
ncbi:MAG: hypothetical protein NTW29_18595 [Bacteroidetes bacterium]|nr:hypothetical protein [Bacteroidota bacterium]